MTDGSDVSQRVGADVIQYFQKTLPDSPGVYRMLGENGKALYVGKAKSLKKRVASYTNIQKLSYRLQNMVHATREMEFVVTQTEAEALLLEANLIKKLKPHYNILLRDDKSFPHIHLTGDHDFPMVRKHRGARRRKGEYFGPYASAGEVNRTLAILQRVFMLRNCTDHVFANRTRPCLQYHIKRCTAPCVDLVGKEDYAEQVEQARDFLRGKSRQVQESFTALMKKASAEQEYEKAAGYRDRIKILTSIQAHQDIHFEGVKNADVMALVQKDGQSCVQMFFFRGGGNTGNQAYFPRHDKEDDPGDILSAFIAQFYENKPPPAELVVNLDVAGKGLLERALQTKITHPSRGKRKRMVAFVENNALAALERHQAQKQSEAKVLQGVAKLFGMEEPPERIEVYDNSHISGTNMVGAMIVAGAEGLQKNAYRKFNIKKAAASDDVGMMREVLERRFKRALKEENESLPDLVLIDGGKGQLNVACEVFEELGVPEQVKLVAIAKGKERNAGRERFFMPGKTAFQLPENDSVLHYLQNLRDEAHRFAIGAHRAKRNKQTQFSTLDDIPGVGALRKKELLHYFGSAKAVADASVQDLAKVSGISKSLAQKIYDFFH